MPTTPAPTTNGADDLLDYDQVETEYGIKRGTLYALVHTKRIPHLRFGRRFVRFQRAELRAWLDAHRVDAV